MLACCSYFECSCCFLELLKCVFKNNDNKTSILFYSILFVDCQRFPVFLFPLGTSISLVLHKYGTQVFQVKPDIYK